MNKNKHFRQLIFTTVLLVLLIILLSQVSSVRAIFNGAYAFKVFLRVQSEIMQKTPAGQYYEAMFWKHNDELLQILYAHPEHKETFLNANLFFVPELDALLNGEGDHAYIMQEHVDLFRAELDWFASMGSSALRDDIQREQQRIPLDIMVGMNMNEALEFVNSSVSDVSLIENQLVPGSDGLWAYHIYNGVYFEYPANFSLQISESENNIIYLIPSSGSPDYWNSCVIKVRFSDVLPDDKDMYNPRLQYPVEMIKWEENIQNVEFSGIGFITSAPNWSVIDLHAFQFNEENQLAVETIVMVNENPQLTNPIEYSELVNQRYEYFQHLVESLQLVK